MPRFKYVNSERIQLTAEEEIARDAEEKAWADDAVNRAFRQLRFARNTIIAETDWVANSDVTMSEAMTTYRQALRDIPEGLSTVEEIDSAKKAMVENTNPVKPS
tara:strand:+ start:707 stop:1018 length:312 start_codon:yes stop_codon:yes gene_type:complete